MVHDNAGGIRLKSLMTGNEAIARGAWEAGVRFATAYPGTPSTEILENIAGYDEIRSQWSVNEKTALETALGGSIAGARTICAMKHVGLNVAADPLFSSAYMGVNAGLVIVTADDPGCHSSQNEQDNRNYAKAAKLPLIEPSNSQEALDFVKVAFELSEAYSTPVLFRITTRLAHGKSVVTVGRRVDVKPREYVRDTSRFVLMPAQARTRHGVLEDRLIQLEDWACTTRLNRVEWGSRKLGIITSGVAYHYAHEVFGEDASYLKLGMSYPFPKKLVEDFAAQVDRLVVIEELDPFIEDAVRAMGIEAEGKALIPRLGELDSAIIAEAFEKADSKSPPPEDVTGRPPMFCAGCPHRGVFYELGQLPVTITGDIGCYTLGSLPPFAATETCICMGASISAGLGFQKVFNMLNPADPKRTIAVIGDSTFYHSGMTGLLDAVYNDVGLITIILDNRITAMTGHQENPGSGYNLSGQSAPQARPEEIAKALGVEQIATVNPYDLTEVKKALDNALADPHPSVIVSRAPCALLKREAVRRPPYCVDQDACRKCKACLKVACPALYVEDGEVHIDNASCVGCGVCAQVCRFGAINQTEKTGEN